MAIRLLQRGGEAWGRSVGMVTAALPDPDVNWPNREVRRTAWREPGMGFRAWDFCYPAGYSPTTELALAAQEGWTSKCAPKASRTRASCGSLGGRAVSRPERGWPAPGVTPPRPSCVPGSPRHASSRPPTARSAVAPLRPAWSQRCMCS